MSIASEITRLQTSKADSKAQINIDKDIINDGIDFINNEKVDSYDEKIAEMQEAYKQYIPINSTSDTQIEAPKGGIIIGKTIKGNTTQNGTPTPDAPIEVENVTGLQNINVSNETNSNDYEINLGKNLMFLNNMVGTYTINGITFTSQEDGTIKINGTSSSSNDFWVNLSNISYQTLYGTPFINIRQVQQTIKSGTSGGFTLSVSITNGTLESFSYNTKNDLTACLIGTGASFNNAILSVQLEKGTIPTTYSPYFTPIELNKIGNYQDFIRKGTGKNIFDNSVERKNAYFLYPNSTGHVVAYSNSTLTYSFVNCCNVEQGKTYTISWTQSQTPASTSARIGCIVDNDNIVRQIVSSWLNAVSYITFTANSNGFLILCTDIYTTNIQIEENITATYYEPYGYKDKWYIEKNVGKYKFLGTENWQTFSYGTNSWSLSGIAYYNLKDSVVSIMSNIFQGIAKDNRNQEISNSIYVDSSNIFAISNTPLTSKTEVQNATKDNYIYYVLANPTYTLIENEDLIEQLEEIIPLLEGQNNISVDGSIPAYMDLDYIVKADRYLIGNRREGK